MDGVDYTDLWTDSLLPGAHGARGEGLQILPEPQVAPACVHILSRRPGPAPLHADGDVARVRNSHLPLRN
eukprot:548396-Heterocapsa_arctica.AAC.1